MTLIALAGITGEQERAGRSDDVNRMLACYGHDNYSATVDTQCSFGWHGGTSDMLGHRHHVYCLLDGDIFNAGELLAHMGLNGLSDAELFAELYLQHGLEKALASVNGDFALALYDQKQEQLWLGRDRFGIKPLYYAYHNNECQFASRPGPLLTLPGFDRTPDRRYLALFAASHYRTFDNEPAASPFQAISQLPAASFLCFSKGNISTGTYWDMVEQEEYTESADILADRYRELLLDAVAIRLDRAGKAAFTLSGGMDSSSVLCCAARVTGEKKTAFSSVYADKTYDEREDIQDVVRQSVDQWNAVEIDNAPDLPNLVARLIEMHDEPVATATWLSHSMVCDAVAKQGFVSLFGGLGGDELNAGEYEYFPFFFADLKQQQRLDQLEEEITWWANYHDHPVYKKDATIAASLMAKFTNPAKPGQCLPDPERIRKYASLLQPGVFDIENYQPVMDHPFTSYLKNRTWQDLRRETLPCCLRAEDRQCRAFGLKHFDPFLDYRLVEFMYRIPGVLKINNGVTKILLRQAMKEILPEATRTRVAKTGWNAPVHRWFTGRGAEALKDLVNSTNSAARDIYDLERLNQVIEEHERIVNSCEPAENHMMLLWQVLNLELWLRHISSKK